MSTLTTANSSFSLTVADLYPVGQSIQGYAADDAFTAEAVNMTEIVMGVDGKLSAGFVFDPVKMTVTIMPTSPSLAIFENWAAVQKASREVYKASAVIRLPGIRRKYTLSNGYLTSAKPFPDNKKTMQAVPFVMTWESIVGEDF